MLMSPARLVNNGLRLRDSMFHQEQKACSVQLVMWFHRQWIRLSALAVLALTTSCGHIITKSHTYTRSEAVEINGAKVSSAVKPAGGNSGFGLSAMIYMAGSATLDGPFIWRIEAEGEEGKHLSMVVHRIKVITSKTKRSDWYPQKQLGYLIAFKEAKKDPGKVYAVFQIPGKLKVYPRDDGDITILADIAITTDMGTKRNLVKFDLVAETTKEVEFVSLPSEIIKGSEEDPRDWKWENDFSGGY